MDLRYIVQALQDDPFRRDVTSVTLDQLSDQQRLQLLSDVISEIEGAKPNEGPDIHYESQADTVQRISKSLGNFNFNPSSIADVQSGQEFFVRLVKGEGFLIFKTLEFLVCYDVDALKKRAYLAKYLVKIDIPVEFGGEREISELYGKYEELVAVFQDTHQNHETAAATSSHSLGGAVAGGAPVSTEELRVELGKLDSEKAGLTARMSELKQRVNQALTQEREADKFTNVVRKLRSEQQMALQIREQICRVRHEVSALEQQLGSGGLKAELQHAKESNEKSSIQLLETVDSDLQGLLFRKDKINALVDQKRAEVANLQAIAHQTLFPRSELVNLHNSIEQQQANINKMMEEKLQRRQNSHKANDTTLTLYRSQAQAVSQKREALDSDLNDRRHELHDLSRKSESMIAEIEAEHASLKNIDISEEQITHLKYELKSRHEVYKQKRDARNARMKSLDHAKGEMAKALAQKEELVKTATELEGKYGVPGFITKLAEQLAKEKATSGEDTNGTYDELKEVKSELDDALGARLDQTEMAGIIEKAQRVLSDRRDKLRPLSEQVNVLKGEVAELGRERGERKVHYDGLQEQLDTTSAALESNVQGLRRSAGQEAERYYKLDVELVSYQAIAKRIKEPETLKAYMDSLETHISKADSECRKLKRELRQKRDDKGDKRKIQAWANLLSIFQAKSDAKGNSAGRM